MINILDKIKDALREREEEGIRPSLLIINAEHERLLFTEGGVAKNLNAEDYILDEFNVELFVITTPKITEPQAAGYYLLEK